MKGYHRGVPGRASWPEGQGGDILKGSVLFRGALIAAALAVSVAAPLLILYSLNFAPAYPDLTTTIGAHSAVRAFQPYLNQVEARADSFMGAFYHYSYDFVAIALIGGIPLGTVYSKGRLAFGLVTFFTGLWFFAFFTAFDLMEGVMGGWSRTALNWIVALDSRLQWVTGERALIALALSAVGLLIATRSVRRAVGGAAFMGLVFECLLWMREPGVMTVHATNIPQLAFVTNFTALGGFLLLLSVAGWREAMSLVMGK